MAPRNKCLVRNNKSGPSNPKRGWVRSMNPFRRWRDEPVGRAAKERFTGRLDGRFRDEAKLLFRGPLPRNGRASIGTECASRAQFYEGRLWLSNLSTCRLPSILACSVEPNNESCKQYSRQLRKVAADVSLPSQCWRATQTQASQPRATRSPERSKSAFWKR